jgi:hypothetical protein
VIVLFTDFGTCDPYVGQVKARIAQLAPNELVVDLLHEVPPFNAHAGAHLLAAFAPHFPPGCVFLGVVDPGVGGARDAVVVTAGARWFVGPDNGLFSVWAARAGDAKIWRITWRPPQLSASFHGRDLFAVVAADIARGAFPQEKLVAVERLGVEFDAGDLARILYVDHYGNAWTGVRASAVPPNARVLVAGHTIPPGEGYPFVGKGEAFWFANSVGLVEIAANRDSAARRLGLEVGDRVTVQRPN